MSLKPILTLDLWHSISVYEDEVG